jgi:hypothetical protein
LVLAGGIQGAITIPMGFFECLRMLIIPHNSLKFRLLVDSNPPLYCIWFESAAMKVGLADCVTGAS